MKPKLAPLTIGLLALSFAGCSGNDQVIPESDAALQQFGRTTFEGQMSMADQPPTQVTLQTTTSASGVEGEANFEVLPSDRGLIHGGNSYNGGVSYPPRVAAVGGQIAFDIKNLSPGSPYTNLRFSGNYQWNGLHGASSDMLIDGTVTATTRQGQTVTLTLELDEKNEPALTSFQGTWSGTFVRDDIAEPYSVTVQSGADPLHPLVTLASGEHQVSFVANLAGNTLSGEFSGNEFGHPDRRLQWYVHAITPTHFEGQLLLFGADGNRVWEKKIIGDRP